MNIVTTKSTAQPSEQKPSLLFTSGGFELYVPPTPFSISPEPARFVMLDDLNDVFYDVDYGNTDLENTTSWTNLALHTIVDPAIVFLPNQWHTLETDKTSRTTGLLVSIESRGLESITAARIGRVHVKIIPQEYMNWAALESLKGPELPTEMKAGLLRHVFDQRPGANIRPFSFKSPRSVLDKMSNPWHRHGESLNWQLDRRFAGATSIGKEQNWKLYAY